MAKIRINPERTRANLNSIQQLLDGLKADARRAEDEKDPYMLGVYRQIIKVVSPITTSAAARLEREELALLNRAHKELKKGLDAQESGTAEPADTNAAP